MEVTITLDRPDALFKCFSTSANLQHKKYKYKEVKEIQAIFNKEHKRATEQRQYEQAVNQLHNNYSCVHCWFDFSHCLSPLLKALLLVSNLNSVRSKVWPPLQRERTGRKKSCIVGWDSRHKWMLVWSLCESSDAWWPLQKAVLNHDYLNI